MTLLPQAAFVQPQQLFQAAWAVWGHSVKLFAHNPKQCLTEIQAAQQLCTFLKDSKQLNQKQTQQIDLALGSIQSLIEIATPNQSLSKTENNQDPKKNKSPLNRHAGIRHAPDVTALPSAAMLMGSKLMAAKQKTTKAIPVTTACPTPPPGITAAPTSLMNKITTVEQLPGKSSIIHVATGRPSSASPPKPSSSMAPSQSLLPMPPPKVTLQADAGKSQPKTTASPSPAVNIPASQITEVPSRTVPPLSQLDSSSTSDVTDVPNCQPLSSTTSKKNSASESFSQFAAAVDAAPPDEQRQMIGQSLFPQISSLGYENAGKLTGMLLELPVPRLLQLLQSPAELSETVKQASKALDAHQSTARSSPSPTTRATSASPAGAMGRSGGGSPITPKNVNTRLCKYWVQRGMCALGDKCTFAHGVSDMTESSKAHVVGRCMQRAGVGAMNFAPLQALKKKPVPK